MRKFLLLALLIPMLVVSCKDAGDDIDKGFEIIKPFTLSIEGTTVDDLSVSVDYSKSMASHPYIVGAVEADYYDENLKAQGDEAVKDYILDQLADKGVNPTKIDNEYVFSGIANVDVASAWELEAFKGYYVAAFAVDGSDKLLTNIELAQSALLAPQVQGNPYATLVSTSYNSIVVDVAINGYEGNYYVALSTKDQFERVCKGNPSRLVASFMEHEAETGHDLTVVDNIYVFDADAEVDLSKGWSCHGETDYYIVTFGVDVNGYATTEIDMLAVRGGDYEQKPLDITLEYAGSKGIEVSTKSECEMPYVIFPVLKSEFVDSNTFNSDATILAGSVVYSLLSAGVDPAAGAGYYSFLGSHESLMLDSDVYGISPDTEYVLVAFHVDDKACLASSPVVIDAPTPQIEDTGECLGSIAVSDVAYTNASVAIDAGDYAGIYYAAPFRQDELKSVYGGDKYAMINFMISYEIANGHGFSQTNNRNKFIGDASVDLAEAGWSIVPGCEYVMYAFGVSSNGTLLTEVLESDSFSTPSVSSTVLDIDVHDVGDNGAIIDFSSSSADVPCYRGYAEATELARLSDSDIAEYLKFRDGLSNDDDDSIFYSEDKLDLTGELDPNTEYYAVSFIYFKGCGMVGSVNKELFKTTGESLPDVVLPEEIIIPDAEFGTVDVTDIYSDAATLNVKPIDNTMGYLTMVIEADYFDSLNSVADAIIEDLRFYECEAEMSGKSLRSNLKEQLRRGPKSLGAYLPVNNKEYVAYVYGFDVNTCQPVTKVEIVRFTNRGAPQSPAPAKSSVDKAIHSSHPFGLFNGDAAVEEVKNAVLSGVMKLQCEEQDALKLPVVYSNFLQIR